MKIGERIASVIAPEAVKLTTEFVERLRASHDHWKSRAQILERENKSLLRQVMKWKREAKARDG